MSALKLISKNISILNVTKYEMSKLRYVYNDRLRIRFTYSRVRNVYLIYVIEITNCALSQRQNKNVNT